jgi:hypothetical protein
MLGLVGGFILVASLLRFQDNSKHLKKQMNDFAWKGAVVGGIIGAGLATHDLVQGVAIISILEETTIALEIGIVAGALAGIASSTTQSDFAQRDDEPGRLLAESTWTNWPEPNPIVSEIVTQIAELEGKDPMELDSLATYINPDVFEKLRTQSDSTWHVSFQTDKYDIHINSYGTVWVYDNQLRDERLLTTAVEHQFNE